MTTAIEINCETGEVIERPLTADEIAANEAAAAQATADALAAQEVAAAKAAAKANPTREDFIAAGCVMDLRCRCKYCSA